MCFMRSQKVEFMLLSKSCLLLQKGGGIQLKLVHYFDLHYSRDKAFKRLVNFTGAHIVLTCAQRQASYLQCLQKA